ncbi:MAG: hypothetical protein IKO40_05550 [Kiritimatiellae bacterium]|nr:hypothetical protein [Kiritimatiellia bacterium]
MRDGHSRRLADWDYSKGASFFITLTLEERRPLFGRIEGDKVALSPLGQEVLAELEAIPRFHPEITLFGHVVMPDHVHFNCHLAEGLNEPLKVLGRTISGFKAHTTRVVQAQCACTSTGYGAASGGASSGGASTLGLRMSGGARAPTVRVLAASGGASAPGLRVWRLGYHDHLCLSREFIAATERYIAYNPPKWALMHGSNSLRIVEPLFSTRLDPAQYWKGVGNTALLGMEEKLVSLRVSMKVTYIAPVVERMEKAVDKGYTVISGFVSRGEQAVRDMLCRRRDAKLIRLRPSCIHNARFRPESAYVQAFAEGRCLELGRGNDEVEFGRAAYLDVNREIIDIATAGQGLAVYFTKDGLTRLA